MINISKEVKFELKDNEDIIRKLRKKRAVLIGGFKEKTTRYDDENGNYEKDGKFIRVRSGLKNIISFKEKLDDSKDDTILKRNDIEVEIGDISKMQYILEVMGLKKTCTMEKYRLKWKFEDVDLNVDELPFGLFLEIHGEEEQIAKVMEELELARENIVPGTYWDIFEKYKRSNNIEDSIKNIEFEEGYAYRLAK